MWIVALALRRPYTFIVMALVIIILTPITILRTPTDIFPDIDIPVVSVVWFYTGMSPQDMADRIVANSERGITTTVNDIEHMESQSVYGLGVIKVFFRPGTNVQGAIAQITAIGQTSVRSLPIGTTPPLIISYSASTTPIIQLGLSSKTLPEQQLFDLGQNFLRNYLATVPGAATPYPYGGKIRQIQVDLDLPKLQSYGLQPVDIVNAVNAQNLVLPSGTIKLGPLEYNVEMNGTPQTIAELNDLPVKTVNGSTLYMRDVAHIRDGFSPQTNIVRADGNRGALMSIYKNGNASTLQIVSGVKNIVQQAAQALPPALKITSLFDQSLFVRASIEGVLREGLIAAALTAVMILIFLGDWRPTIVISISIPLSIFVSIILLGAIGQTINIMTLGGLALAVGILVDDATVEIENIERNLAMGKEMKQAILDGAQQIAVPAFVSTLSICIVFVPMFFLTGVAKFLFVPLAEAVSFAMLASYLLSRTLIPTLVMYIMRGHEHRAEAPKSFLGRFQRGFERKFEDFRRGYEQLLETTLEHRGIFVLCFLAFCLLSLGLFFFLGQDFFPQVDAGLLRLHVRARPGLRVEETARLCDEIEATLRQEIPKGQLQTILDNIGLPNSGINQSYSSNGTIGSSDAEILIALDPEHHLPTAGLTRHLREVLPRRFPGTEFFFQPADIVTQILNFGLPAPIDVQIIGTDMQSSYVIAQQIANKMRHIPGTADVHVQQLLDLPTLHMDIDRTRATQVGITAGNVAQSVLVSLSGSFQTSPNFWLNPKNEVTYQMAVQAPQYRMTSMQDLMTIPVTSPEGPQLLSNLVQVYPVSRAATVSHWNVAPVIDVYASTQGRDLGAVAADTDKVLQTFDGHLPRGTRIVVRGQVATMRSSFFGLGVGLVGAILLVYLLIVINFQSWLDPFIIIAALPGALAGICWFLLLTRTTLSVPSLTGAVMCMGVATANSILMVSFAREQLDEGIPAAKAAVAAGYTRMRPVLMTALAMIIGMVPMALGFGEGGEQNAPLGRAVIGGLLFATVATLFFVPSVFAIFHGRREAKRARGQA
ncbi:MAG TPA: efflux RND transporter permease subunit [Candidatus Sulfotelmatobacter sp.]|nr:efflux RND transporter permease subunit [Candidatus Sulfotelmatobacter sp.]HME06866.1 efflux RND transporter permease subunit [Bryobacteraceae bacterium]